MSRTGTPTETLIRIADVLKVEDSGEVQHASVVEMDPFPRPYAVFVATAGGDPLDPGTVGRCLGRELSLAEALMVVQEHFSTPTNHSAQQSEQ